MFKRALLACLLAIGLGACAGGPALFGQSAGTLSGHVTMRACGGAYRPEQAGCSVRAVAGATVSVRLASGNGTTKARTAVTDGSGAYTIELAPGTYVVELTSTGAGAQADPRPAVVPGGGAAPRQVTVVAGKTVTADLSWTIHLL
jgi:carboxypeptidase family protein